MKIQSISSHHYADGGVGEVFESTRHFWSFRGKLYSNMNVIACGHLDDTTGAVWRHVMGFLLFCYN